MVALSHVIQFFHFYAGPKSIMETKRNIIIVDIMMYSVMITPSGYSCSIFTRLQS
jgi:hypothetical protein